MNKGKISLSRTDSNQRDTFIGIDLYDELGHVTFARIEMSMEAFGKLVTGLAYQPMNYEVFNLSAVGKVKETEVYSLYVPSSRTNMPISFKDIEIVAQPLVDAGWQLDLTPLSKMPKRVLGTNDFYEVPFVRWVDKHESATAPADAAEGAE